MSHKDEEIQALNQRLARAEEEEGRKKKDLQLKAEDEARRRSQLQTKFTNLNLRVQNACMTATRTFHGRVVIQIDSRTGPLTEGFICAVKIEVPNLARTANVQLMLHKDGVLLPLANEGGGQIHLSAVARPVDEADQNFLKEIFEEVVLAVSK